MEMNKEKLQKDIDSFWESPEVDLNFLNKKKTLPLTDKHIQQQTCGTEVG